MKRLFWELCLRLRAWHGLAGQFLADRSGNFAIIFGVSLMPLMFLTGITVDYVDMMREQSRLQETSDATALYSVKQLEKAGFGKTAVTDIAEDVKDANFDIAGDVALELDTATKKLTVSLTKRYDPAFLSIWRSAPLMIHAFTEVTYSRTLGGAKCFVSLNNTGKGVLSLNGNAAVVAPSCNLHVNSSSSDAVDLNGGGTEIRSAENCFVGGVQSGLDRIDPPPLPTCHQIPNPFVDLPLPDIGPCDYWNAKYQGKSPITVQPGTYCGGLAFGAGAEVTLAPGLYIIKDGALRTTGSVSMRGDGVTFFFTGNDVELDFSGTTTFHLTAMTTGELKGFVVFFDPRADLSQTSQFTGTPGTYFEGILYFAEQDVTVSGDAEVNTASPLSVLIANTITLNGNGSIHFNVDQPNTYIELPDVLYDKTILTYISK
jgi:hypothetical protein